MYTFLCICIIRIDALEPCYPSMPFHAMPWIFRHFFFEAPGSWATLGGSKAAAAYLEKEHRTALVQLGCSRAAVILSRKMPERFVPSISRKRLTQTRTRIVCLTSAMELMNLSPKVRQHCWSWRNPAPETISCTNSLSWRKKAFVLSVAAELLASLPGTNSFPIPLLRVIPTLTHYSDIFWHCFWHIINWKYIYIYGIYIPWYIYIWYIYIYGKINK